MLKDFAFRSDVMRSTLLYAQYIKTSLLTDLIRFLVCDAQHTQLLPFYKENIFLKSALEDVFYYFTPNNKVKRFNQTSIKDSTCLEEVSISL